mmetsp:Transcript_117810/g.305813  ORF Transcript_117810/g.305813 Transcript_117810/m.305813 type:complete len:288 (+) Transcript_117810:877-1740(+)
MHGCNPENVVQGEDDNARHLQVVEDRERLGLATLHSGSGRGALLRSAPEFLHGLHDKGCRGDQDNDNQQQREPLRKNARCWVLQQQKESSLCSVPGCRQPTIFLCFEGLVREFLHESPPSPRCRACRRLGGAGVHISVIDEAEVLTQYADGQREEDNAAVEARHADDLANGRDRCIIAVADGCHRDTHPPKGIGDGVERRDLLCTIHVQAHIDARGVQPSHGAVGERGVHGVSLALGVVDQRREHHDDDAIKEKQNEQRLAAHEEDLRVHHDHREPRGQLEQPHHSS